MIFIFLLTTAINQKTVAQKLRENVEMTCIGEIVGRFRQTEEIAKQTLGLSMRLPAKKSFNQNRMGS